MACRPVEGQVQVDAELLAPGVRPSIGHDCHWQLEARCEALQQNEKLKKAYLGIAKPRMRPCILERDTPHGQPAV